MRAFLLGGLMLAAVAAPAGAAPFKVLWLDATPEFSGQAPNALRKEMSDYLTAFEGGSVFQSTYVDGMSAGSLAAQLASNSFDVVVIDGTNSFSQFAPQFFNAADLQALQTFYAAGKNNLMYDGNLYVRSINFNASSDFPGINGSTGGLTVNSVFALARRGGGILFGTDHNCCQGDVNYLSNGLLGGANFSGFTIPSTDGQFNGTELLSIKVGVAPADILQHWDTIPSQGIAPTGTFTDFLGASVTLYSQVDVADKPGGGIKNSLISTSFSPTGGDIIITDPKPPVVPGVPEPATWGLLIAGFGLVGAAARRRRAVAA